jgi:hypothetical protein
MAKFVTPTMKREIVVGAISAIAFAAAFTAASLALTAASCKVFKGTMVNGSPAYIRIDGIDALMVAGTSGGIPSGTIMWTRGDKVLYLKELPEKLVKQCWR